ncbi:thermonuclease family protein [Paracoccus hibiscisoli]|uniref:Thermonuclease family protein n=1 Tax=Paracoccus hibiscisoli TaxID=2023261 RepID=A0A4U0QE94_9RHOB|nr:thermonuclease family protein [Paracoccus hibiscisoli]TJZ79807.1 thermonuclease family protein [Paracoccus hibiscisoli]
MRRPAKPLIFLALSKPKRRKSWMATACVFRVSSFVSTVLTHPSDQTCQDARRVTWRCGEAATDRLAQMIADTVVTCKELDRDRYERSVSRCEAAGGDLAEAMVAEGLAWAYLRYSDTYAPAETVARQQGFGIWSGVNQPAWEYRAIRRADTSDAPECRIKGNISQSGDRIYHLPDSRSYAATRISEAKGERWFCSEEEARTAGWRAPRG